MTTTQAGDYFYDWGLLHKTNEKQISKKDDLLIALAHFVLTKYSQFPGIGLGNDGAILTMAPQISDRFRRELLDAVFTGTNKSTTSETSDMDFSDPLYIGSPMRAPSEYGIFFLTHSNLFRLIIEYIFFLLYEYLKTLSILICNFHFLDLLYLVPPFVI